MLLGELGLDTSQWTPMEKFLAQLLVNEWRMSSMGKAKIRDNFRKIWKEMEDTR